MVTNPDYPESSSPDSTAASRPITASRLLATRIYSYPLTGLFVGITIHLAFALTLAAKAHGPNQAQVALARQQAFLWIPLATTILVFLLPIRKPIAWLSHRDTIWCQRTLGIIGVIFDLLVMLYTYLIWKPLYFG